MFHYTIVNEEVFSLFVGSFCADSVTHIFAVAIARYSVFLLPIVLLFEWFLKSGNRKIICGACASGLVSALLSVPISVGTHVSRPFAAGLSEIYLSHISNGAFPSTHAALFFGVGVSLLLSESRPSYVAILVLLLGMLTSWARICASLHYPFDIVGSLALASAVSICTLKLIKSIAWPVK